MRRATVGRKERETIESGINVNQFTKQKGSLVWSLLIGYLPTVAKGYEPYIDSRQEQQNCRRSTTWRGIRPSRVKQQSNQSLLRTVIGVPLSQAQNQHNLLAVVINDQTHVPSKLELWFQKWSDVGTKITQRRRKQTYKMGESFGV